MAVTKAALERVTKLLKLRRRESDHRHGVETVNHLLEFIEQIPDDCKDHLRAKNALITLRNLYQMRIHVYQKAIARMLEKK